MRIAARFSDPDSRRFTVAHTIEGEGKVADYVGPKYGHVRLRIDPTADDEPEFRWEVRDNSLPYDYMPGACRAGVEEFFSEPFTGRGRLVRVRVTITGGSYHDQDSQPAAVTLATKRALVDALGRATLIAL